MVLTAPMVLTKTHGIESFILNHTHTRGPSATRMRDFHQLGPLGLVGLVVAMCVCFFVSLYLCLSPFHVIFLEASHWSSHHMTRSRPFIGQPSFPPKKSCYGQCLSNDHSTLEASPKNELF